MLSTETNLSITDFCLMKQKEEEKNEFVRESWKERQEKGGEGIKQSLCDKIREQEEKRDGQLTTQGSNEEQRMSVSVSSNEKS